MSALSRRRVYGVGLGAIAIAIVGVSALGLARQRAVKGDADERATEVAKGPHVQSALAKASPTTRTIKLQGETVPFAQVTMYAKVSGYIRSIKVDKGDRVKRGQLIAEVESAETDSQYDAALADALYKRANANRALNLVKPGVVSANEAEIQVGQAKVAEATLRTLATTKQYQSLRAPFDGTVTARFVDVGSLVQNATNAQTGALPVVTVSDTAKLRVSVYVDQDDAPSVHLGDAAEVATPGGVRIQAKVARTADALDARSRTMLVEVDVDNANGAVIAGSFVVVTLTVTQPSAVEIPVQALDMIGGKPQVAIVEGNRINRRPVEVLSTDGSVVRLKTGIAAGDRVALNVSSIPTGATIQLVGATGGARVPSAK